MISVEIPLRTLRDEIVAVANYAETPAGANFAAGVVATLQWIMDRECKEPFRILLEEYETKLTTH